MQKRSRPLSAAKSTIKSSRFGRALPSASARFILALIAGLMVLRNETNAKASPEEPARLISLDEILAYAEAHSPILAVAESTRSRAEAERVAASILLPTNPELSLALGPRKGIDGAGLEAEIGLMQEIRVAGERKAQRQIAERLGELTEAEIGAIRWSVHCDVHAAYHQAIIERERLRLAESVVEFQVEVLRIVERQIAAGDAAQLSLRLAQAEVAQAEQRLVGVRQSFHAAKLRLAQLAGWPIEAPPEPAGAIESPREPPPLAELHAIALRNLPRLRALEARTAEAEARGTLAAKERAPRPSIGVQYKREGSPRVDDRYHVVVGALALPIPSFQRNQGERARAGAEHRIALAELEAERRLLEGKLAEARSEVMAAAARTRAYGDEILPHFEENLSLLRRSFELGEIDLLALSTGRVRFLAIQSDALAAQRDYFTALAGLERLLGVELFEKEKRNE